MGPPQRDAERHTYADYLTWTTPERFELIDGAAIAMAPAPDVDHQEIAGRIYVQVMRQLAGRRCRAFIAPLDVRLPKPGQDDARTDTVVQPDLLVVCDPAKIDRRGVCGAPDWVVEVLSPATAGHDLVVKRRVYERAGVREYWLVHPTDRVLQVYTLAAAPSGQGEEYGRPEVQELLGSTVVGAVDGVVVAWDEVVAGLGPVP